MSFAMTMLSWSVIEYSQKYKAIDEYDHVRELIKWGTDYLLLTFNSSASRIDKIYSQVLRGNIESVLGGRVAKSTLYGLLVPYGCFVVW